MAKKTRAEVQSLGLACPETDVGTGAAWPEGHEEIPEGLWIMMGTGRPQVLRAEWRD